MESTQQSLTRGEINWAVAAHLSSFAAAWFGLGAVGPALVYAFMGRKSKFVRRHAAEACNFNLTILALLIVVIVLANIFPYGFIFLAILGLVYIIETIRAASAASRGTEFRYVWTIRLLR